MKYKARYCSGIPDRASLEPAFHLRNVGRAPLGGTSIITFPLIRHIPVDSAEHHPRRFEGHYGIGDLGPKQALQLRRIYALIAHIPAMDVAGGDRGNPQRRRSGGRARAHQQRDGLEPISKLLRAVDPL